MTDQIYPLVQYNPFGGPSSAQPLSGTRDGAARVALSGTRMGDASATGTGWSTMTTSAVAAIVVRPSATAKLELWNGNTGGTSGTCLVVDRLFAWNLVATAVNSNAVLWGMVTIAKAAPSTASLAVIGNYGKAYSGSVINAIGTTVGDNGWFPFGPNYTASNAAAPGGGWEALVEGRLIVPPQCSLCVQVSGSIVGDTYTVGAAWFEEYRQLP